MKTAVHWFYSFERFVDQWWYSPILGFLAAIDHYVLVFPILGMVVSSIFLKPSKWLGLSLWSAIGSWLGAALLAVIAKVFGLTFIQTYFPQILESSLWDWTQHFFSVYGVWIVFLVGLGPMPQQPPMIISALAGTPLLEIASVLLLAKVMKFTLIGYLASHAPQKLSRFHSLRKEFKELEMEPPTSP